MVKLINLTPHEITIYDSSGSKVIAKIPPSGKVARCRVKAEKIGEVNGIPVFKNVFGEVENLPDPQPDTYYIVSTPIAQALPNRKDLLVPDTTPASVIRDSQGRIIGVKRFQVFWR